VWCGNHIKCCGYPGCEKCCLSSNACGIGWGDRNRKWLSYLKLALVIMSLAFSLVSVVGLHGSSAVLLSVPYMKYDVVSTKVASQWASTRIYDDSGLMTILIQDKCPIPDSGTTPSGLLWNCKTISNARSVIIGGTVYANVWGTTVVSKDGRDLSASMIVGNWTDQAKCSDAGDPACTYNTYSFPMPWKTAQSIYSFSTEGVSDACAESEGSMKMTAIMTVIFTVVNLLGALARRDGAHDTGYVKCPNLISNIMPIIFNSASILQFVNNCYNSVSADQHPVVGIGYTSFLIALFFGNIPCIIIDGLIPVPKNDAADEEEGGVVVEAKQVEEDPRMVPPASVHDDADTTVRA